MMNRRLPAVATTSLLAALLAFFCLTSSLLFAQAPPSPDDDGPPVPLPKLNLPGELGQPFDFGGGENGPKLFFSAQFEIEDGTRHGRLHLTAEAAPGWHTYSMTQKKTDDGIGPNPSKLTVNSPAVKLAGPFLADQAPEIVPSEGFFHKNKKPLDEEHYHKVTWTAPIELAAEAKPEDLVITVNYDGMVCSKSCELAKEKIAAKFAGYYTLAKPTGEFTSDTGNVSWKARLEPATVAPGGKATLTLTATPKEPYHIYAYSPRSDKKGYGPTLIALKPLPEGWKQSAVQTSAKTKTKAPPLPTNSEIVYHEGPVTWTIDLAVPADASAGKVTIAGLIGFQVCTDQTCDMPTGAAFDVELNVTDGVTPPAVRGGGSALVALRGADFKDTETLANATAAALPAGAVPAAPFSFGALATAFGAALLGGLILNVMPCVLPVIPLKLLSFVEQAGTNRAKLLSYNLVYAAGTIFMFLVLAVVGIVFGLSWGEQFGFTSFQIIVTLFMFAMTLSLLGLWEIPLPGAIGSGETVSKENAGSVSAAFWKGFMTTIYATPCSGPFLGLALGATISFPAYAKLLVFFAAGLGFASPYIVLGLLMAKYPSASKYIPSPACGWSM